MLQNFKTVKINLFSAMDSVGLEFGKGSAGQSWLEFFPVITIRPSRVGIPAAVAARD